jgi:hypothetical protein
MIKKYRNICIVMVVAIALGQVGVARAADANPPERMTYQGYLVDGNGVVLGKDVPVNYDVVFRVYAAKSGGEPLWSEQQTVTVDNGYFSVLLGEGSAFDNEANAALSTVFDGGDISDRFIGITVDLGSGASEIAPRLRLLTSPFAFTARQARKLSDSAGNSNFYKSGSSLKLGAGTTPTLTLPEAGGATLVGKLTPDLPGWGSGLQIDNGALTTTFGAQNSSLFHFKTGLPGFYFDKQIVVNGDIRSHLRDTVIGPSNNTDTFLRVKSGSDVIDAYTDRFYVVDPSSRYLDINPTSSSVDFNTDTGHFYMNKELRVGGDMTVTGQGSISSSSPTIKFNDSNENDYWIHTNQNRFYVLHGEGSWNGNRPLTILDGNKVGINDGTPVQALNVGGNIAVSGSLLVSGSTGLRNVTGQYGSVQTTGNGVNAYEGYSIDGRYVFMSADNDHYGIYNDVDNKWVTLYQKSAVSGGRYTVNLNGGSLVLNLQQSNGSRYASYDGDQNWDFYSDRRLKENIVKEDNMLDRIMQLDVVNYDFIDEKKKEHKEFGFIAQEVEPLFPSLVSEQEDDRYDFKVKSIGYSSFGVVALGGIKELKLQTDAEIASLKQEVETLKSEMVVLKASLAANKTSETRLAKLEELVAKLGE